MPVASALTAEQEQALQSDQRSLNNPQGVFTVPRPAPTLWLFHEDTIPSAQIIVLNLLRQMMAANAKPEFTQVMAHIPLVTAGDALPPQKELASLRAAWALLSGGLNSPYIALRETEQEGIYNVIIFYTDRNGETLWTTCGILYDAESGFVMGTDGAGIWGSGLEFDFDNYIARLSPGNKNKRYGFNIFYDIFSPLALMFLDTVRFPFEYNGKEFMIQIWKGSYYLISNGGEISIYERPLGRFLQWDASEDTNLDMTMRIYQKGELFLDFGPYRTWWLGGFRFGNPFRLPVVSANKLRMTGTIIFEDQAMLDAFLASFRENKPENMTGDSDGLIFYFDWENNK